MLAGEAEDEMQNDGAAIEQFRAAVKADPEAARCPLWPRIFAVTQNQFEEAAKQSEAELANVPEHAQALAFLADCYMQLNRSGEAMPLIQKLSESIPMCHARISTCNSMPTWLARRRHSRTQKTAAWLSPTDPNPHSRLARLYQAMGNKAEANLEFQKTSALHKLENETIASKLKAAQEKGKAVEGESGETKP